MKPPTMAPAIARVDMEVFKAVRLARRDRRAVGGTPPAPDKNLDPSYHDVGELLNWRVQKLILHP